MSTNQTAHRFDQFCSLLDGSTPNYWGSRVWLFLLPQFYKHPTQEVNFGHDAFHFCVLFSSVEVRAERTSILEGLSETMAGKADPRSAGADR